MKQPLEKALELFRESNFYQRRRTQLIAREGPIIPAESTQ
jgi:hypothetical protein